MRLFNCVFLILREFVQILVGLYPFIKQTISFRDRFSIFRVLVKLDIDNIATKWYRDEAHQVTTEILGMNVSYDSYDMLRYQFQEIFYKGEYSFTRRRESPTILDCGANIGIASLYFTQIAPLAKIYAFEPNPISYAILSKNQSVNNLSRLSTYNVALSDSTSEATLYLNSQSPSSTSASLVSKEMTSAKNYVVKTMKLSDFLSKLNPDVIDLIKLDVEGSEEVVYDDLLTNGWIDKVECIYVDIHGNKEKREKFISKLRKNNFTCHNRSGNTKSGLVYAYK